MKDSLLVPALRLGDPRALGAVHDAYAGRLYAYCWSRLHSRDAAGLALRDTLMWAQAHIHELPPGMRLAPWLYGIARAECARRRLPGGVRPDVPPARPDQDDALARVVAWRAVAGLPPLSSELLDLRHRHDLAPEDIGAVVGRPVRDVAKLLGRGRALLEAALVAEILAVGGPFECAGRTELLRRGGDLLRHSRECVTCGRRVPRRVSVARVYGLLPRPAPPRASRSQVMRSLTDPALAHYRLLAALRRHAPHPGARRPRVRAARVTGAQEGRVPAGARGTGEGPARRASRAAAAVLLAAMVTGAPWLARLDDGPRRRAPAPRPALDVHPITASKAADRPRVRSAGLK